MKKILFTILFLCHCKDENGEDTIDSTSITTNSCITCTEVIEPTTIEIITTSLSTTTMELTTGSEILTSFMTTEEYCNPGELDCKCIYYPVPPGYPPFTECNDELNCINGFCKDYCSEFGADCSEAPCCFNDEVKCLTNPQTEEKTCSPICDGGHSNCPNTCCIIQDNPDNPDEKINVCSLILCDFLCVDTCETANNGICEDGGPGSRNSICEFGEDCVDCGIRQSAEI